MKPLEKSINWDLIVRIIDTTSDLLTIMASVLAIYLFTAKRKEVGAIFRALMSATNQSSMSDLRAKLDRLNDLNAGDADHRSEVVNICHEVCGQIDGNPNFSRSFADVSAKLRTAVSNARKPITEPQKRALVSELRESMRHFDTLSYVTELKDPT